MLRTRPLGELAELTVGHVGPMAAEYVSEGVPFLRSLNVRPFRIETSDIKFISHEFHERLRKSMLRPGDVVVVRTGAPGTAAVVPESLPEANCSDLVIIRPHWGLDSRYLAYLINGAARGFVNSRLVGAVQQHFNVGAARELPIPDLSLEEQRRIAGVLGALDDLIDTNGCLARCCTSLTAALFRRLVKRADESVAFSKTVEILSGGTPKTSEAAYWGGSIPWFTVADTPGNGEAWVLRTTKYITELGLERSSAKLIEPSTTIVTARGTVGNVGLVGVPMAINQSCYGLRSLVGRRGYFTFFATLAVVSTLRHRAHGSVFDTITRASFDGVDIALPSRDEIATFECLVDPLMQQARELLYESESLRRTRDELLPLLLSGRVRVEEVAA